MDELVTEQGWRFFASSEVMMGDKRYDMDDLSDEQRLYVSGKLNEQALNAAFAGRARFRAENLPELDGLFT